MKTWVLYSLISMAFAGITAVIAKFGLKNVSADTGLAVRTTSVMLIVAANSVFFQPLSDFKGLSIKDVIILALSGVAAAFSWIFYYRAVKIGNVSQVALIDKGSILITLVLSFLILGEQFTWKVAGGAGLILAGILVLTLK